MEETEKSLEYLQDELRKTSMVEVQQSIYRVMETQVKSLMFAKVREQYAFKVVDPQRWWMRMVMCSPSAC